MGHVISCVDKTGRNIYLTNERWAHIQKHPEMANHVFRIMETLVTPEQIIEYSPAVNYYSRFYKDMQLHLLVIVKYLNGKGFIITSFYTDRI